MSDSFDKFLEQGEQQSPEWRQARVGMVTGSRFADVLDKLKNGTPGAKRKNYMYEVVAERLTGKPAEHYVNAAMEHGTLTEPLARAAYEAHTGAIVEETGLLHHKTLAWVGGSVDGLVGDDGIIECKCPTTQTHIKTLLAQECEHVPQIQGYLWITGRQFCDFVSFDNRLPAPLDIYVQRIERDEGYIVMLEAEIRVFLDEISAMVEKLKAIR
jgi:putative phage-type endonuclease